MSYYKRQPSFPPKHLPRVKPKKVIPSGIGDEGIVGNWLFYYLKGGNHLHDFSGQGNHGTISGAKWVSTRRGWALDFDGVDDIVTTDFHFSGSFTLVSWVYIVDTSEDKQWFGETAANYDGAFLQTYASTDEWLLQGGDGSTWFTAPKGGTVTTNEWRFIVGVYDSSTDTAKLYVDGDFITSADWAGWNDGNATVSIGYVHWNYLAGMVDYSLILGRVLSESEISLLHSRTSV